MLNFTVGPVQMDEEIRKIGYEQIPYFRTTEFSNLMFENESYIKRFANAPENSRVVFITGSGTASMEATVMNVFNESDKVLIVNGGSFGHRFVELCNLHKIQYTEINLKFGQTLTENMLKEYDNKGYTGFLVNICETSTGIFYDIDIISEFCKRNNLFLVVDAISSFLANPFDMEKNNVGVMITGSQKALACPPGISIIVLSPEGLKRVNKNCSNCMYFDLKIALQDGERGQTPFTPAVGTLIQINTRLKGIEKNGGFQTEIERVSNLAKDFRDRIKDLPLEITSSSLSNSVTPIHPLNVSAYSIFTILKEEYDIWICPNGGELKDKLFRVGHIGDLTIDDNKILVEALKDMKERNLL